MGFRLPRISNTKRSLIRSLSNGSQTASKTLEIPKGYFAVYVGESEKKRFVIPISYLNQPSFMDLLSQGEEEFGYDHPMGGITIPCSEASAFQNILLSQDEEEAMLLLVINRINYLFAKREASQNTKLLWRRGDERYKIYEADRWKLQMKP